MRMVFGCVLWPVFGYPLNDRGYHATAHFVEPNVELWCLTFNQTTYAEGKCENRNNRTPRLGTMVKHCIFGSN